MKKQLFFMALMGLVVTSVVSCDQNKKEGDKSDGNSNGNSNSNASITNTINAKWEIADPQSAYASFEFNKDGNYIVVEKEKNPTVRSQMQKSVNVLSKSSLFHNGKIKGHVATAKNSSEETKISPIHFGTYQIDGNKIILSGFGILDNISITADEITFSFTLEKTGESEEYRASKTEDPIYSSTRTEMFCRTWKLEKVTIDESLVPDDEKPYLITEYGENWKVELEREENEQLAGLTVLFSKAGTYLILYVGEESEAGLSEWKWVNKEETAIYYSWDNWEDEWEENIVQIELTSSTLKIKEGYCVDDFVLVK